MFKKFQARVEAETGTRIKNLRSDNAKEYVSKEFESFLDNQKIVFRPSVEYSPQENGTAEREMRTLCALGRAMLKSADLPGSLWSEAIKTAAYIMNRVLNRRDNVTPYEQWHGNKPSVAHLRVFGCKAYTWIPEVKRKKLDDRAEYGRLVGYGDSDKIFRVYHPGSRQVDVSRDVDFDEPEDNVKLFPGLGSDDDSDTEIEDTGSDDSGSDSEHEEEERKSPVKQKNQDEDIFNSGASGSSATPVRERASTQEPPAVRRKPGRPPGVKNGPKKQVPEKTVHLRDRKELQEPKRYHALRVRKGEEPRDYDEAVTAEDSVSWIQAMEEEMSSQEKHKCWTLVKRPRDVNVVGCKWAFRLKQSPDGTQDRYKARLCAKGFTQEKDVDYTEIFFPVVRYDAVRVFLSLVASEGLHLKQFDVKTAFLYGTLEEEIWMEQPPGFNDGTSRVCKLLKGLYGLKQSPRTWNKRLDSFLRDMGMKRCEADHCIYVSSGKERLLLALYVDDGLVACDSEKGLNRFLRKLEMVFEITSSEPGKYVGMEISQDQETGSLTISQWSYIRRILERFNMSDCKDISTPGNSKEHLRKDPGNNDKERDMDEIPYRQVVGSLMYAVQVSRPDIAFQVSCIAKYMADPHPSHWQAAKRILRYLAGTLDHGIRFTPGDNVLSGFCDASHGSDYDTGRSVSGFLFTLNEGVVSWSSKLQDTVSQSTTESEYISLAECAKETVWLRRLIEELTRETLAEATVISCDNTSAIKLSKNPEFHRRSKHIKTKYHYTRELQDEGIIRVDFVPGDQQPADMLTKNLCGPTLDKCLQLINFYRIV